MMIRVNSYLCKYKLLNDKSSLNALYKLAFESSKFLA